MIEAGPALEPILVALEAHLSDNASDRASDHARDTSRTIDEIRALNPSAEVAFLVGFTAAELEDYRRRLLLAVDAPKSLPWVRRNDVWPVVMRECA